MPIPACLIIDDFPINASYWARRQQSAFGFTPTPGGQYGFNWPAQAPAAFCPVPLLEQFADLCETYGVRGKFTLLPYPAGLGRIDGEVRGVPAGYIGQCLEVVRRRIAPRFDIVPEGLTHTMALDIHTGALLPHVETPWITYLAGNGRHEELVAYYDLAWQILRNVGLKAGGVSVGGLPDLSNIVGGQTLNAGHHREALAAAVLEVVRRYQPEATTAFIFGAGAATAEPYKTSSLPQPIHRGDGGATVYELLCSVGESLLNLYFGQGDPIAEADAMISPDLARGTLVECIEAGRALVMLAHTQTLNSLNTGLGLRTLGEAFRRLHQRYGREIQWMTPLELCAVSARTGGEGLASRPGSRSAPGT